MNETEAEWYARMNSLDMPPAESGQGEAWEQGYATNYASEHMHAVSPIPDREVEAEKKRAWQYGLAAARRHRDHPNNRKARR